jgi:hypothetical protein
MPITIHPVLDGALPQLKGQMIHHAQSFHLGALPGGMQSGKTSIAIIVELPDGRSHVFAEASLREFHAAAKAIFAKYADELRGQGLID